MFCMAHRLVTWRRLLGYFNVSEATCIVRRQDGSPPSPLPTVTHPSVLPVEQLINE